MIEEFPKYRVVGIRSDASQRTLVEGVSKETADTIVAQLLEGGSIFQRIVSEPDLPETRSDGSESPELFAVVWNDGK